MQRQIYIVISQTGTILSRILKLLTKAEYNHVSISLDAGLHTMYSFGRRNPYNPIVGGFVQESPHWGTFQRFPNTKVVVLSVPVTQTQYGAIEQKLAAMFAERRHYHYNYLGLVLAGAKISYHHARHYYCSEFVMAILSESHVTGVAAMSAIVKPIAFLDFPGAKQIYCGKLMDYIA